MLNFKDELSKYKPVLQNADIEKAVNSGDDVKDVMDLLAHLAKQINHAQQSPPPRRKSSSSVD